MLGASRAMVVPNTYWPWDLSLNRPISAKQDSGDARGYVSNWHNGLAGRHQEGIESF